MSRASNYEKIWEVIAEIPYGRVASYGQVASLAGLGRRARLVGYALHQAPDDQELPWHRVINAGGRISFPRDSRQYAQQKQKLEAEGVVFLGERIDLTRYRWQPEGDDIVPEMFLDGFVPDSQ